MVQVYQNEFVFGQGGGRGVSGGSTSSSPSLLKSISSAFLDSGRNKKSVVVNDDIKVVGASFSHLGISNDSLVSSPIQQQEQHRSSNDISRVSSNRENIILSATNSISASSNATNNKSSKRKSSARLRSAPGTPRDSGQYTDLDDDWDADMAIPSRPDTNLGPPSRVLSFDYPKLNDLSIPYTGTAAAPPAPSCDKNGLKLNIDSILEDPVNGLNSTIGPKLSKEFDSSKEIEELNAIMSRFSRFKKIVSNSNINIANLKKIAWNGVPPELRTVTWQILLGYLPTNQERRASQLQRKRQEYLDGLNQMFYVENKEQSTWHQIEIDVPRTNPKIKLYQCETTQRSLERILYLWAVRHPASGYVQGINDLTTPFYQTFLSSYIDESLNVENFDPKVLPKQVLDSIEADTFWCLTKLLEGIQDNYIHAQPGILRQVNELKDLINRIDSDLFDHLMNENVEFIQFSFRWMNCLLMREISVKNTIRMWDTYLSENNGFSEFHVYVCAAFLVKWSDELKEMEFQDIMMFLQNPPTKDWTEKDIELLLSEAFIWQSLYKNAVAHLK